MAQSKPKHKYKAENFSQFYERKYKCCKRIQQEDPLYFRELQVGFSGKVTFQLKFEAS